MKKIIILFSLFIFLILDKNTNCIEIKNNKKDYCYLAKKETFCRNGPGYDYKILFQYNKKNIPLLIKHKIDNWYYTIDDENQECWININMVKNDKLFGIVKYNKIFIHRIPEKREEKSEILGFVTRGAIIEIKKIYPKWVRVKIDKKISGWIKKGEIWLPIN